MSRRTIAHARTLILAVAAALAVGGAVVAPTAATAVPAPVVVRTSVPSWPTSLGSAGFVAVSCVGVPKSTPCITKGAVVAEAQRRLLTRKYTSFGVKVTGVFDAATGKAIKKFKADQAARGNDIGSTPRIGIKTYKALLTAPVTAPKPTPRTPTTGGSAACTSVRGRTCKATSLTAVSYGGRSIKGFCPIVGATVGDGWGAGRNHEGIDLLITMSQMRSNLPIYAVEGGTVLKAHKQGNGALVVQVAGRSGAGYFYGHLRSMKVSAGDKISAGQVLGYAGDTGSPGSPHLHFQFHPTIHVSAYGNRWLGPASASATPLIKSLCF